ncbi:MAG TPA: tetratricopeptide repeat protein [Phnomibacter sp.]|nr:tetratricopeptide repeat protein [Phnomibacter sp.]
MGNFSNRREREEMEALLRLYQKVKMGRTAMFIEEEDFERIIDYYDEKEETQAALEAANIALEQFPYAAQLMFKKADLLIAEQQYYEALELLEEAAIYDSSDISLYILKTDAYLALEQPEKAARLLEDCLGRFEGDDRIDLLFELADVYDDYEDFQKVFDCMRLILEEDPNNEEALLKICFWADFTGNSEASIKLHQWILEEYPFNEMAWFNLGTAFQGLKLYEKAVDAYQYALAIDEKLDIAWRNMGDAFIRQHKYTEAIEALSRVLELSRPEDVIYEAIGHCYHKLENYAQARFHYRKASHINPEDSRIHYKIAVTYVREGAWDNAIKQLNLALRTYKNQPEYNLLMGECYQHKGMITEAVQYYAVAIKARPKNVTGREALIECLITAGYLDEALQECQTAMDLLGGHAQFTYLTSAVLFLQGQQKQALVHLEKALANQPKGFKKMLNLVPGILTRPQVPELVNRYLKKRKG